jgi:hypothetical protein
MGNSMADHCRTLTRRGLIDNTFSSQIVFSKENKVQEDGYNCGAWITYFIQEILRYGVFETHQISSVLRETRQVEISEHRLMMFERIRQEFIRAKDRRHVQRLEHIAHEFPPPFFNSATHVVVDRPGFLREFLTQRCVRFSKDESLSQLVNKVVYHSTSHNQDNDQHQLIDHEKT